LAKLISSKRDWPCTVMSCGCGVFLFNPAMVFP
jgi:hypothetical protein